MINIEELANNLDFDIEDVCMLLDMFTQDATQSIINIGMAIETKNYELLRNEAHSIKGSASNLMLDDISVIAYQIERLAKDSTDCDYQNLYNSLKTELVVIEKLKVADAL